MDVDDAPIEHGDFLEGTAAKAEFIRRISRLMAAKGWTQADLARAAFGTIVDTAGRTVPRNRDLISTYLNPRRKTLPRLETRKKLADALGVDISEIDPRAFRSERRNIRKETPTGQLVLEIGQDDADEVILRINRRVSLATARQILDLLGRGAAAGKGG